MISKDQIQEFSKRLAIDEFTIIREYIQIVFLSILYNTTGSQKIYFKGGTAIHLLLKSGRFSEDLDFTAKLSTQEIKTIVNETIKKLNLIIPNTQLKDVKETPISYSGILSYYPNDMKHPLNIHLDFSLREQPETAKQTMLETEYPVVPQPIVRHLDWSEMLAEKIRAFLVRSKGRDIYDLWFMLSKGVNLDWDMINRKVKIYHMTTSLQKVREKVNQFDDKQIQNDLGKFLPAYDRNLVKHLKEATINQLKSRQSFIIAQSTNIDYTKMPAGSFSGFDKLVYDLKQTIVNSIERQDENVLLVKIRNEDNQERLGYIRARTRNGIHELNMIEKNAAQLIGKSYDALIYYKFVD